MELLKTIRDKDVVPNYKAGEEVKFNTKTQTVRAVILDENDQTPLIFDKHNNHYKIPGGGIESGESLEEALNREVLEEAGCQAEVIAELGKIVELPEQTKKQLESDCYLAKLVGEKGEPQYDDTEKSYGYSLEWINFDEAIVKAENVKATTYNGHFMRERDLTFLKKAKEILDGSK